MTGVLGSTHLFNLIISLKLAQMSVSAHVFWSKVACFILEDILGVDL